MPPYFVVPMQINYKFLGIDIEHVHATNSEDNDLGFQTKHLIKDLKDDYNVLNPSKISYNKELTMKKVEIAQDILGDILPVVVKNRSLEWFFMPTYRAVELMGTEAFMFSMYDYPDEFKNMLKFIGEDTISCVKWMEKEGILTLNNENDYTGAGSFGFTNELPENKDGKITTKDLWCNMNSQESTGLSPDMFGEFVFPIYKEMAKEFGLVYFGCCEAVHDLWDKYISNLPNLRKVSISAWCNEEYMGNALKESSVIYSVNRVPTLWEWMMCFMK